MYRYKQKFTNTYVDRHVKQIKVHQHIYSVRPLLAQECWANVSGLGVVLVSLANYVQPWVTRVDSAAIHRVVLVRCGRDRDELRASGRLSAPVVASVWAAVSWVKPNGVV